MSNQSESDRIDSEPVTPSKICIAKPSVADLAKTKPKYQTDPKAFLVPILIWGPNNQVTNPFQTRTTSSDETHFRFSDLFSRIPVILLFMKKWPFLEKTHFWKKKLSNWLIYEVIDFAVAIFRNYHFSKNWFRSDHHQKWPIFEVIDFQRTYFSMQHLFRSDRFHFERFQEASFRNDRLFSKWSQPRLVFLNIIVIFFRFVDLSKQFFWL